MESDLAWTLSLAGRHEEALQHYETLTELMPGVSRSYACFLRPLIGAGKIKEAADIAAELMKKAERTPQATEPADVLSEFWEWRSATANRPVALAVARARIGDAEGALEALEAAHAERDPLFPFVHLFSEFRVLLETPRFQAMAIHRDDSRSSGA